MAKRALIEIVAIVELDDDETHAELEADMRNEPFAIGEVLEGGRFKLIVKDIGEGTVIPAASDPNDGDGAADIRAMNGASVDADHSEQTAFVLRALIASAQAQHAALEALQKERNVLRLNFEQREYPCSPHCAGYIRELALQSRLKEAEEALRVFAECAKELEGSEDVPRAPDGEWAKFRLLTDDYRKAAAVHARLSTATRDEESK